MSNFIKFMQEHRGGMTEGDISDQLRDLVAAVTEEGRGGKLTITISMKPMGKGDGLEVAVEAKAALPKPTAGVSIFFASPENALVRQDPRQQAMELRQIAPSSPHKGVA